MARIKIPDLTQREKEVFTLWLQGNQGAAIADALQIERGTVLAHLDRIAVKLGVHTPFELRVILCDPAR